MTDPLTLSDRLIIKSAKPAGGWLKSELASPASQAQLRYAYIDDMAGYLGSRGVSIASPLSELPSYHLIAVPDGDIFGAIVRLLRAFGDPALPEPIELVEPDYEMALNAPATKLGINFDLQKPGTSHLQYISDMTVPSGGNITGDGIKIAVVDTGVEPGILLGTYGTAPVTYASFHDLVVSGNTTPTDTYGHGTAMIKIIENVAPQAEIYAIRITDTDRFRLWDVMAGINTGAHACHANIVNLSLGCKTLNSTCLFCGTSATNRSTVFEAFLKAFETSGTDPVFVCATGNDGAASGFHWPARYASTLAVGSIDHGKNKSSFSNTGTSKGNYVLCPGGDIDQANTITEYVGVGDDNGTDVKCAGTSPAAAYASGVIALYRQKFLADLAAANSSTTTISSARLLDSVLTRCQRDSSETGVARLVYDDTQPYP